MRVLMVSKACVVGAYQKKLEELAALPGVELTAVVPPEWRDERGVLVRAGHTEAAVDISRDPQRPLRQHARIIRNRVRYAHGHGRQLETAAPAAAVGHGLVAVGCGIVGHGNLHNREQRPAGIQ
mgnify:CR=1 FL=1